MTPIWTTVGAAVFLAGAVWVIRRLRRRHVFLWLPAAVCGDWAGKREWLPAPDSGPTHILFCIADHFEPAHDDPGPEAERRRVEAWVRRYPELAASFRDADGRPPRHTFFYPAEQYDPEHLDRLAELVRAGYGEVEIHLHHADDTSDGLRSALREFMDRLVKHGHLGSGPDGAPRFGFVHGNWSLDNSLPDGSWCGVNDELRMLAECGCYADFTLPSAPSAAQTRRINSIYYAVDDPERPKSHDDGVEVRVNTPPSGDLMIVQGPLTILWPGGKFGVLPRLEAGNLSAGAPPTPARADAWIRTRVCVSGRPDWVFVKVHTHGCAGANPEMLLGDPMRRLHERLCRHYNDGTRYRLHYVTAREMVNIIHAAEQGKTGDPGTYRNFEIRPPVAAVNETGKIPSSMETIG